MADREFVLRFLAFSMVPYNLYRSKDFDSFLNDRLAEINKMQDDQVSYLSRTFKRTMNIAFRIFGSDSFRKRYNPQHTRYPINKALFEAWSVSLSKLSAVDVEKLVSRKELLLKRFMDLLSNDHEFENAVSQGTGDTRKVLRRFSTIETMIQEVLRD